MYTPRVVLLNGTSSAGKTSIAIELQRLFEHPHLHLAWDHFMSILPANYLAQSDAEIRRSATMQLARGFHRAIAALHLSGWPIIVDHIFHRTEWLQDCVAVLDSQSVFFIGVHCSLEEVERREQLRGDRMIGLARRQSEIVHTHRVYDFEVDTSSHSPQLCAQQILEYLRQSPLPRAFAQLHSNVE
jgi:chloramphenicol 3-O phosphotransferase